MKRNQNDLKQDLTKQVGFLKSSCANYDAGEPTEALRIAVIIRVLVHDTSQSHSLLSQMHNKNNIKFLDSAAPIDPQPSRKGGGVMIMHGLPGLVGISSSRNGGIYIPVQSLRDYVPGYVSFDKWWNTPCIPGHNGNKYSRKQLVLQMANKEGGAHIDKEIDEAYRQYTTSSLGMSFKVNGVEVGFVNSAADASMREIGWEMLETLQNAHML
jgi:hypothetical protein